MRVWSAGCSTGEEPYTIAITILEEIEALRETRPFTIIGTDISRKALLSAETAIFNSYAMRHVDAPIREKYFTKVKNGYAVNDSVKGYVKFKFMNLNDAQSYRKLGRMDILFCRNVLIYFDEDMKKKVANHFHDVLKPGGYLFLGHSEYLYSGVEGVKADRSAGNHCISERCGVRKVLVVDDSICTRKLLSLMLKCSDYVTFEAEDGLDALEKLSTLKVDLVIVERDIPNMDGLAFVRSVRKQLLSSGYARCDGKRFCG